MAGELAKRVAVAAVGIPFAAVVVYLGGWVLAAVLAIVAALGTSSSTVWHPSAMCSRSKLPGPRLLSCW
jgi:hypothetical protein